jgi:hypothetical protein
MATLYFSADIYLVLLNKPFLLCPFQSDGQIQRLPGDKEKFYTAQKFQNKHIS